MNNSVFGETMKNFYKRVKIQLCHNKKRLLELSAKAKRKSMALAQNSVLQTQTHYGTTYLP